MLNDLPHLPQMEKVTLHPGERYASAKPTLITTLLGSCVAACLYDPVAHVAGMNHFLLANKRYARNMPISVTEAGRYGVNAMELLINDMIHLGAEKKRIRAKVFGGGAVLDNFCKDNFQCVGDVNERFIREFLKTESIPLEAEDLGGTKGRVIRFRTDTYAVYRRYIMKITTAVEEKKEHGYWRHSIEENQAKEGDILLFK
jgi:chemotaxis protein CheD